MAKMGNPFVTGHFYQNKGLEIGSALGSLIPCTRKVSQRYKGVTVL